jgi:heme-degrading monooxygenase HmoA
MIVRIWHGATPVAKADAYLKLMREVALPDYKSTPGNKGAYALRRIDGGLAHFHMLTFWESLEAIERFAGRPSETAKYYEFDEDFLVELEPTATHYEAFDH